MKTPSQIELCYIDPVTSLKFYSIQSVTRYLENLKSLNGTSKLAETSKPAETSKQSQTKVQIERWVNVDGLPKKWILEIVNKKVGGKTRKDRAASDEEKMLFLFFNRIGWPTSLPTNEKEAFTKSVLVEKQNALDELVMTKSLPLRPGLESFVDDALIGGIPVVILTTYSKNGEKMARSIIEQLGQERISRIQIVGKEEMERSFYGQLVLGKGASSGLDEQLAKEARKAASAEKQKIAKEVASMLKVSVDIDTSTSESSEKIVATLRAGAEYAGVPVKNCVLIAGSQPGVLGAQRIGMSCIVLRSSLTSRAEFPSADAVMDGFGGADLTLSRLRLTRGS